MCEQAVQPVIQAPGPGQATVAQRTTAAAVRRGWLTAPLATLLVLFMGMSGCVPVPYRPAATLSHTPVGGDTAALDRGEPGVPAGDGRVPRRVDP